jgi:predicted PurR-regulated permease PerM
MTAVSKILAGVIIAVALIFGFFALHDALKNLGRPEGNVLLGGLLLIASISLLIAFGVGCILWMLTVISEQIEDWGVVASMPVGRQPATAVVLNAASEQIEPYQSRLVNDRQLR